MSAPTVHAARTVDVWDISIAVREYGEGEPLLIINGTSQSLGFWAEAAHVWAGSHRGITYDLRGLGNTDRGAAEMTVTTLAADALGLLDALGSNGRTSSATPWAAPSPRNSRCGHPAGWPR